MPLRCLLFSSDEGMAQPIWQALTDLGVEGEYCHDAVAAVERVTTQLFQIVITDWDDQPEAEFLLKTARELKPAYRPLTLAIVKDDSSLPKALQAGANSILRKPIQFEHTRDTLHTACELLRAKMDSPVLSPAPPPSIPEPKAVPAIPPAFATSGGSAAAAKPASVMQTPEKAFRAGEFLQPGAHTAQLETQSDMQKSMEQAAVKEVDLLSELEPMAAAVEAPTPEHAEVEEKSLHGWAALKARLRSTAMAPGESPVASAKEELLSFSETPSYNPPSETAEGQGETEAPEQPHAEARAEAELFAYIRGDKKDESEESVPADRKWPAKLPRTLLVGALAATCVAAYLKVPRAQWPQNLRLLAAYVTHAGHNWLNPQPVAPPQAPAQHENFGSAGDEYKLPVVGNIPDATTDPSQIRVLPVIDPTAKPPKDSAANAGQTEAGATANDGTAANQAPNDAGTAENQPVAVPSTASPSGTTPATLPNPPANVPAVSSNPPPVEAVAPPEKPTPVPAPAVTQPRPINTAPSTTNIPSSLKSQMASMTPDASGNKPPEAALPSIEPVDLTETVARGLLAQSVDPAYPDAAKASGQQGTVTLQVLIGRDGTVQDTKFLQGSLMFARSAIDAVRQWRFKPYSMNGRAVSAKTVLTLSFGPPT